MTRLLSIEEVLPLRALVLRDGKLKPEECYNEGDDHPETFHTGYLHPQGVIGIATFMIEDYPSISGVGFRLRGMAVHPEFQGTGIGRSVLQLGYQELLTRNIDYLWCNARKIAFPFYEKEGFTYLSEEFDIPGIGPHKAMYRNLK